MMPTSLRQAGLLAAALLALPSVPGRAGDLTGLAGAFAHPPVSARVAALQDRTGVLAGGTDGFFSNPAALVQVQGLAGAFGYTRLYGLLPYLAAWGGAPLGPRGVLGAALTTSGDALYRESSLRLAYARLVVHRGRQVDLGAALDLRYAGFGGQRSEPGDVSGQAWGFGVSVGARLWLLPQLVLGLSFRDALSWLSWQSSASGRYSEGVPPSLAVGLALFRSDLADVAVNLSKSLTRDARDRLFVAGEKNLFHLLRLRGSYALDTTGPPQECWNVGLGIEQTLGTGQTVRLDLAYSIEELPSTLRVTLSVTGR